GAAIGALTHPSGSLSLSYVDISGSRTTGVNALGRGTLSVACSTIRDGDPQGSSYGLGVMAQGQGAEVLLEDTRLLRNPRIAAYAELFARLTMRGVEIRDTRLPDREGEVSSFEEDWHGKGVYTWLATLNMVDTIVDNSAQAGIHVLGGTATLDEVTVSNTWTDEHHIFAAGLYASGANVTVTDSLFEANDVANVLAGGFFSEQGKTIVGSNVTISNSTIRDGQPSVLGSFGVGVLSSASTVEIQGSVLEDNLYAHILSTSVDEAILTDELEGYTIPRARLVMEGTNLGSVLPYSTAELANFYLRALERVLALTNPEEGASFVSGISLLAEDSEQSAYGVQAIRTDVELRDVTMTGTMNTGLHLVQSSAEVEELTVHDTVAWMGDVAQGGAAIRLGGGSDLTGSDVCIEDVDGNGVVVEDSTLELSSSKIKGTRNVAYEAVFGVSNAQGVGLLASEGDVVLTDVTVSGAQQTGMTFVESVAMLEDVTIEGTERGRYTEGLGLSAVGSQLTADRLVVEGTDGAGVVTVGGGALLCTDCDLRDNRFAGLIGTGEVTLDNARVTGNLPHPNDGGGFGLLFVTENIPAALRPLAGAGPITEFESVPDVQDAYSANQGRITVTDSFIGAHEEAAVFLLVNPRSVGEGVYRFSDNTVESTAYSLEEGVVWPEGSAFFISRMPTVWDEEEGVGLLIEGGEIRGGGEAAIFLHGSTATIDVVAGAPVFQQSFGDSSEPTCEDLAPPQVSGGFSVTRCPEFDEEVEHPEVSIIEADNGISD
ncbi:MAG: hypothetical protein ACI8S6_001741, partial [Myxococcota bacterium]